MLRRNGGLAALILLGGVVAAGMSLADENWGKFKGEVVAKFLRDGRNMRLEEPFAYVDPSGREWSVPAGSTTDGASVPQFFWVMFPPFTGKYRAAAVVHDYYCQTKARGWKETHEAFYNASRAAGVGEKVAKAMYGAVYSFGPRWGIGMAARGPGDGLYKSAKEQQQFFRDLDTWIKRDNPSLEEISKRLDSVGLPK
jgi:hypothetical protein